MLRIQTRKAEMDENMQRKGTCQNTDGTGEMECVKILTVRKRRMCKITGDEKSAGCCAGEKMQSALSEPGEYQNSSDRSGNHCIDRAKEI